MIDASVATLQPDPTIYRLRVVQNRFGLHADTPLLAATDRIPRSTIAGDRQRHLGLPTKRRMQPLSEALEEAPLPGVAKSIAAWIGLERKRQAEGSGVADHDAQRHHRRTAPLDPTDLRLGDARGCLERALAQPGSHASSAQLSAEGCEGIVTEPVRAIARALAGRHTFGSSDLALYWGSSGETRPFHATTGPRPGPNVERVQPPTVRSSSNPKFRRWMDRGVAHTAKRRTVPPRLARPTVRARGFGSLPPRLARPTVRGRVWPPPPPSRRARYL